MTCYHSLVCRLMSALLSLFVVIATDLCLSLCLLYISARSYNPCRCAGSRMHISFDFCNLVTAIICAVNKDFLQKAENVYRHWQDQRQRKKDALKLEERLESLKSGKTSEPLDNTPEGLRRRLDALHGPGHREQREREEATKREWLLGMQSKHMTNPVDQTEQILETALEAHELAKQSKNAALKLQMTNMGIDPQSLLTEAKTVQDDVANSATSG